MNTILLVIPIIGTVILYFLMKKLYLKFHLPILIPVVTTSAIIIILLLFFHIPYEDYMIGGEWIDFLLGPAVVAMAYPLYNQWELMRKHKVPILIGVIIGSLGGIATGALLGYIFSLNQEEILSIIPKSVTTPIAKELTILLGGNPTLTVVYVIIAGVFGSMVGPVVFKFLKITHPFGIGVGMGAASHGIGTAKAIELGEEEGATSSISMTLCALFSSFLCPVIAYLFL